jgi:K+-transporting ATPase ATPase C chain
MLTTLWRQTATGLRLLLLFTVVIGIVYPAAVYGVAHLPGLSGKAEGSVVTAADGTPTGSSLIGIDPVPADPAADPYFHTRPSATADDILGPGDTSISGASNLAGDSPKLLDQVEQRRAAIAAREDVDPAAVPSDAVTASGSGLDPDITPAYAALQVERVARVTGLPVDRVKALVADATRGRILGVLGEPTVNTTELNLAIATATGP